VASAVEQAIVLQAVLHGEISKFVQAVQARRASAIGDAENHPDRIFSVVFRGGIVVS
jgi:hypothetical protein